MYLCVWGVALEKQCHELMMAKFGRVVDLDAVQTMAGNKRLEELKHEKLIKEAENEEEIKEWDVSRPLCVSFIFKLKTLFINAVLSSEKGKRGPSGVHGGNQG